MSLHFWLLYLMERQLAKLIWFHKLAYIWHYRRPKKNQHGPVSFTSSEQQESPEHRGCGCAGRLLPAHSGCWLVGKRRIKTRLIHYIKLPPGKTAAGGAFLPLRWGILSCFRYLFLEIHPPFIPFPVNVEDKAQHGGWILPGWEGHDLVASELNK